ncbi:MAG TPA: carboxypeptidase-like regulatory domain-containing protein, partial [Vicinamibacteria bacterium]|nr:carboxypeptidase-like regulatory domain-containing protein [Vicinamibacteria bacterium]
MKALRLFLLSLLAVSFAASLVHAQTVGATLQGIVTDESGAALPGAVVVVRSAATGAERDLRTDGAGRFSAPALPPGEYELRVSATGFQPVERRGIHLTV